MVMPRSRSSGALSIWSKAVYLLAEERVASTLVMAAVRVVLPWSMCPIVPTFTCGFVRSNFFLAISFQSRLGITRFSSISTSYFQSRIGFAYECDWRKQQRITEKEIGGDQSFQKGRFNPERTTRFSSGA